MKKILLFLNRDQFVPFNCNQSPQKAMIDLGGNSGNSVFQFSLQKLLQTPDQEVTVATDLFISSALSSERVEYINSNYDCIVFSPANVIAQYAKKNNLINWKNKISQIKIPILAIGIGAQSDSDYSLEFINDIKGEATDFISSILETGGAIGTRGYFTADAIKKLGFS